MSLKFIESPFSSSAAMAAPSFLLKGAPHLTNFDEKVHKPQSRIGANMQLFTHIL